jgi:hypothetical protein
MTLEEDEFAVPFEEEYLTVELLDNLPFLTLEELSASFALDPFSSLLPSTLEDDSTSSASLETSGSGFTGVELSSSQAENASIAKATALTKPSFFIVFIIHSPIIKLLRCHCHPDCPGLWRAGLEYPQRSAVRAVVFQNFSVGLLSSPCLRT